MKRRAVMFTEQTPFGELSMRMKDLVVRLEHTLRFKIKVVERTGVTILNQCSQASSWEGVKCGREGHITCNQGLEDLPKCTRSNVVYENICNSCIPDAAKKGHLPDQDCTAPPSLYVGETSRSIQERGAARRKEDTSHMRRHQILEHGGEEPRFLFQVVNYHTTALARQIKEAVCIRRRGGAARTLNS